MAAQDGVLVKAIPEYLPLAFQLSREKPVKILFDFIRKFDQVPIISVGCGNGYLEAYVKKHFPTTPIWGVDPAPLDFIPIPADFYKKKCVKPITPTLEIGKLDKYIGDNILLIIWPSSEHEQDPPYDLAAIKRVKPKGFYLIYAPL